jgi:hypothetical protein
MQILVQHGLYQCATCGNVLTMEPCDITKIEFAIGSCMMGGSCTCERCIPRRCPQWGVRIKIPIDRIECELA